MPGLCRFCSTQLQHTFVDLGMSPISNNFLKSNRLNEMEAFFPLHAYVCEKCMLVQLEEFRTPAEIFSDYAYFSSWSPSWLEHARKYSEMMIERFAINKSSQVIEIASNDGYLLQYFKKRDVPVIGIEPAGNVADVALARDINTYKLFFGVKTAKKLRTESIQGDLIIGNNVLAHVPDLKDFVAGLKILLADKGIITLEFPHLLKLIEEGQFDTIYHEHFSYFSLYTVRNILYSHGIEIFDVEQIETHGGSLRVFCCHIDDGQNKRSPVVEQIVALEMAAGLGKLETYLNFTKKVTSIKRELLGLLIRIKQDGKTIAGYGAPAKGNTLLNYCGIRTDFIEFTVDRSPHKQGAFLPGTHIPVYAPEYISMIKPDYILILPWNLRNEIMEQLEFTRDWGCKFILPLPKVEII